MLVVGVGAREGLGAAIAKRFAAGGFLVTVAGRNATKLAETAKALGGDVEALVGGRVRSRRCRALRCRRQSARALGGRHPQCRQQPAGALPEGRAGDVRAALA
ncbi:MAG: hypothetical protein WDM81_21175 [Rhizomicrobium sp.]